MSPGTVPWDCVRDAGLRAVLGGRVIVDGWASGVPPAAPENAPVSGGGRRARVPTQPRRQLRRGRLLSVGHLSALIRMCQNAGTSRRGRARPAPRAVRTACLRGACQARLSQPGAMASGC